MSSEYNQQCGNCTSDGACEKIFAQKVADYQAKFLIPALTAIGGAHLLSLGSGSSEGLESQI